MSPEDDARWPDCRLHTSQGDPNHVGQHWCDWTAQYLREGHDAESIEPGLRYCVPIVPALKLYAEVVVGPEAVIPNVAYQFGLVGYTDPFTIEEDIIQLGLWTKGEGRLVMAAALRDWSEGYADEKCIAKSHGFEQEMQYQKMTSEPEKRGNIWCLAYYKQCYPCLKIEQAKSGGSGGTIVVNFDASSFGIDPGQFGGSAGVSSFNTNARQQRARDALRQRYGNRA